MAALCVACVETTLCIVVVPFHIVRLLCPQCVPAHWTTSYEELVEEHVVKEAVEEEMERLRQAEAAAAAKVRAEEEMRTATAIAMAVGFAAGKEAASMKGVVEAALAKAAESAAAMPQVAEAPAAEASAMAPAVNVAPPSSAPAPTSAAALAPASLPAAAPAPAVPTPESKFILSDDKLGIGLNEEAGGTVIRRLKPGSQAAALGVPIGGTIVFVNGETAATDKEQLSSQLGSASRPTTLLIAPPVFDAALAIQVEAMIRTFDVDGGSIIEPAEFHAMLVKTNPNVTLLQTQTIYDELLNSGYDVDDDGQLSVAELTAYWLEKSAMASMAAPAALSANAAAPTAATAPSASPSSALAPEAAAAVATGLSSIAEAPEEAFRPSDASTAPDAAAPVPTLVLAPMAAPTAASASEAASASDDAPTTPKSPKSPNKKKSWWKW